MDTRLRQTTATPGRQDHQDILQGFLFFIRGLHGFHGFCFEAVFFDNLCVLRIEGLLKRALSALLLAHNA